MLTEGVRVDLHLAQLWAQHLLECNAPRHLAVAMTVIQLLSEELLPGWYDDWILVETDKWRQLRLHALESLANTLCDLRHFGQAAVAAAAAIAADPLRETARAAMIRVHLGEGNRSEATREFALYRNLVLRELGTEPTDRIRLLASS